MRIIRKGKLPKEQEYKIICPKCFTVFAYTHSEVGPQMSQLSFSIFSGVTCPVCEKCMPAEGGVKIATDQNGQEYWPTGYYNIPKKTIW